MKYPETESEICAGVVPRSCAICGKAGRYMSMENGLTVLSAPRMRMINRFERELRCIANFNQVTFEPVRETRSMAGRFTWWPETSAQVTAACANPFPVAALRASHSLAQLSRSGIWYQIGRKVGIE